jgi:hypothetical protein
LARRPRPSRGGVIRSLSPNGGLQIYSLQEADTPHESCDFLGPDSRCRPRQKPLFILVAMPVRSASFRGNSAARRPSMRGGLGVMSGETLGYRRQAVVGGGFCNLGVLSLRHGISIAEQARQRRIRSGERRSVLTPRCLPPKCLKVQLDGFPDKHVGPCRGARPRTTSVHRPSMHPSVGLCRPSARWFGQKPNSDNRRSATAAKQVLMRASCDWCRAT